jgi:hypothetical protein
VTSAERDGIKNEISFSNELFLYILFKFHLTIVIKQMMIIENVHQLI